MKSPHVRWALTLLALLGLALAGCATRSQPTPPKAPPPVPTSQPAPPTLPPPTAEPVVITYWEEDSDDADVLLDALAQAFMSSHPSIQVARVHFDREELRDRFQAAAATAESPELARAAGDFAGPFSDLGLIQPAETLFGGQITGQFLPGALAGATARAKLWALPDNYGNHLMLLYNKKLVTTVPADTDAWIAQLKTLTNAAKGQYGLAYYLTEPFWLAPWIGGFGGWPLDSQDNPSLNTPAVVAALQFVRDLKLVHKVVPPEADYPAAARLFETGQAAYLIDGTWNQERYREVGVDFGIATLPKVSATGLYPAPMTAGTAGKYWFISRTAEGPRLDAAKLFVEFMTSAQAQGQWLARLRRLPSNQSIAAGDLITKDPLLKASMDQLSKGRGMPAASEMRCAWSGMGLHLAPFLAGKLTPADAAKAMQIEAERCVVELRSTLPSPSATPKP